MPESDPVTMAVGRPPGPDPAASEDRSMAAFLPRVSAGHARGRYWARGRAAWRDDPDPGGAGHRRDHRLLREAGLRRRTALRRLRAPVPPPPPRRGGVPLRPLPRDRPQGEPRGLLPPA